MKDRLLYIVRNSFVRNVAVLTTGTAAAQMISLISSPLITRLYGPEAFGTMGVFMSILQFFVPIAALTYPIAIVLPKEDKNAKRLVKLSIYISLLLASVVSIGLMLFDKTIVHIFKLYEVSSYLYLIPLVILFSGLMQVCDQWLIRTKQFGVNAKVSFLQSMATNGGKIGIGFFMPYASVLIILNSLGNGLKAALMFLFIRKSKYKSDREGDEQELSVKTLAKKHHDFPLYKAPETLVSAVSKHSPVLMLTAFFGPVAAGYYTLGSNVLQKPVSLIAKSVGNVFYPRITEAALNRESLEKLIIKATSALIAVGIIPFGIIIFFGPEIFSLIFGDEWIVAGKYSRWIGLFLFCEFINKPSIKTLPVLSAQLFHMIFSIITFFVRILSLVIGYFLFENDLIAVRLFGVGSAIMYVILILLVIKKSKAYDLKNT